MSETTMQKQEQLGNTEKVQKQELEPSRDAPVRVICSECKNEGETSRVYPEGACTASYPSGGYYDEAGDWVPVRYRVVETQSYRCSRGHRWGVDAERHYPEPETTR